MKPEIASPIIFDNQDQQLERFTPINANNSEPNSNPNKKNDIIAPCDERKNIKNPSRQQLSKNCSQLDLRGHERKCYDAEKATLIKAKQKLEESLNTSRTQKRENQSVEKVKELLSSRRNNKREIMNTVQEINFVNDKFGIEHGKIRELSKEQAKEKFRKEVLNNVIKFMQDKAEQRKNKL